MKLKTKSALPAVFLVPVSLRLVLCRLVHEGITAPGPHRYFFCAWQFLPVRCSLRASICKDQDHGIAMLLVLSPRMTSVLTQLRISTSLAADLPLTASSRTWRSRTFDKGSQTQAKMRSHSAYWIAGAYHPCLESETSWEPPSPKTRTTELQRGLVLLPGMAKPFDPVEDIDLSRCTIAIDTQLTNMAMKNYSRESCPSIRANLSARRRSIIHSGELIHWQPEEDRDVINSSTPLPSHSTMMMKDQLRQCIVLDGEGSKAEIEAIREKTMMESEDWDLVSAVARRRC